MGYSTYALDYYMAHIPTMLIRCWPIKNESSINYLPIEKLNVYNRTKKALNIKDEYSET